MKSLKQTSWLSLAIEQEHGLLDSPNFQKWESEVTWQVITNYPWSELVWDGLPNGWQLDSSLRWFHELSHREPFNNDSNGWIPPCSWVKYSKIHSFLARFAVGTFLYSVSMNIELGLTTSSGWNAVCFPLIAFTIDWFWPHPCCINPEIWQHLRNWMFCLQLPSWKNPTKPKHAPPSGVEVTICSRSRGARPWQMVQKLTKNTFLTQTLADYVGIFDQKTDQTENNWPKTCGRSCFCWGRLAPASTRQTASWFWSTFLTWRFKTEKPPGPLPISSDRAATPKGPLGCLHSGGKDTILGLDHGLWPYSGRTIYQKTCCLGFNQILQIQKNTMYLKLTTSKPRGPNCKLLAPTLGYTSGLSSLPACLFCDKVVKSTP